MNNVGEKEPSQGVIFVATGKKFIEMAMRSAWSIRKHNPNMKIHLFADWKKHGFEFEADSNPFSSVDIVEDVHSRAKVDFIGKSPFERTLYLDADTRVITNISGIFKLLDRFDIALAHAVQREARLHEWREEIPASFPQFNSGVFLYKRSDKVNRLLHDWQDAFYKANFLDDQLTLRELLWISDLRIATLPPEYNIRYLKYVLFWNKREAKPKIFHLQMYQWGSFWFLEPFSKFFKYVYRRGVKIKRKLLHQNNLFGIPRKR